MQCEICIKFANHNKHTPVLIEAEVCCLNKTNYTNDYENTIIIIQSLRNMQIYNLQIPNDYNFGSTDRFGNLTTAIRFYGDL